MILYKYFPAGTEQNIHRIFQVLDGWIYFSNPFQFNDPFELRPTVEYPNLASLQKISRSSIPSHLKLSKTRERKIAEFALSGIRRQRDPKFLENWISSIGVLCLTEKSKNLLMWAHYGDSHRGVCIGFDIRKANLGSAVKIQYQLERPKVTLGQSDFDQEELNTKVLFTKSDHWSYEEEWRLVKRPISNDEKEFYRTRTLSGDFQIDDVAKILATEGGPGVYEFNSESIKSIYFGCRLQPEIIEKFKRHHFIKSGKVRAIHLQTDERVFRLLESKS